jgi:hypothetical protein
MSKATMSKIEATATLMASVAAAIKAAHEAGLSAADILRAIEPLTETVSEEE